MIKNAIILTIFGAGAYFIYRELTAEPGEMSNRNHYRSHALQENSYAVGRNQQVQQSMQIDSNYFTAEHSTSNSWFKHPGRDLHHQDVSDNRSTQAVSFINHLRNTLNETVETTFKLLNCKLLTCN